MSTDVTQDAGGWPVDMNTGDNSGFDELAGLDIDATGVDADAVDRGNNIDRPGLYHLEVADAEFKTAAESLRKERPEFFLRLICVCSAPGQSPQGSSILHNLELPTEADKDLQWGDKPAYPIMQARFLSFLEKCKVIGKVNGQFFDPETKSPKINLRTVAARLKGKQFIGKVINEKFTRKDGTEGNKIKLDQFHPASACDAPENLTTPMNVAALQTIGLKRYVAPAGQAGTTGNGNGRHGSATPGQSPIAAAAASAQGEELDI